MPAVSSYIANKILRPFFRRDTKQYFSMLVIESRGLFRAISWVLRALFNLFAHRLRLFSFTLAVDGKPENRKQLGAQVLRTISFNRKLVLITHLLSTRHPESHPLSTSIHLASAKVNNFRCLVESLQLGPTAQQVSSAPGYASQRDHYLAHGLTGRVAIGLEAQNLSVRKACACFRTSPVGG